MGRSPACSGLLLGISDIYAHAVAVHCMRCIMCDELPNNADIVTTIVYTTTAVVVVV